MENKDVPKLQLTESIQLIKKEVFEENCEIKTEVVNSMCHSNNAIVSSKKNVKEEFLDPICEVNIKLEPTVDNEKGFSPQLEAANELLDRNIKIEKGNNSKLDKEVTNVYQKQIKEEVSIRISKNYCTNPLILEIVHDSNLCLANSFQSYKNVSSKTHEEKYGASFEIETQQNNTETHSKNIVVKSEKDIQNSTSDEYEAEDRQNIKLEPIDIEENYLVNFHSGNKLLVNNIKPEEQSNGVLSEENKEHAEESCKKENVPSLTQNTGRPIGRKTYSCEFCGKTFTSCPQFAAHRRIHTGDKPYSCDVCGKKFIQMTNLKNHKRLHTGEKPYSCEECGKKFTQLSSLKDHKRVHTGDRPFECEECGRKLTNLSNLLRHKRIHTGDRPYSCDFCDNKFRQLSTLIAHKRIHTGERPYSCEECGKKFTKLTNCITHKKIHARVQHSCEDCGLKFADSFGLTTHKKIHTEVKS